MNPIATGAATDRHDEIAGLRLLVRLIARQETDIAAVHERIAQIALVKVHGTIDCRNSHPIAIVADALDYATHHSTRMNHPGRQRASLLRIRRSEAKYIRAANRLRAHAGAHEVADHAADTGV